MGKKKNKNKVSGAVKTATKTDKKLANKLKKELANLGEEDIAKVIAEIEREEAKRSTASEKTLTGPPSPRAYASLVPHPTTDELILFGGEYHNGQKTEVYNELLFYNPDKGTWRQVKAPGAPPPRSAHQAVATSANKGELWVFGGEYTSPSETQFHHYKDLWCFSLAEKKWEKVSAPSSPSSRSGHRMLLLGRKLLVFGGYADDGRDCRYYDDIYEFSLDTRAWTKLNVAGKGPSARSACVMLPNGNDSLVIYGGFSRVRSGRGESTLTHGDMFRLCAGKAGWQWRGAGGGAGVAPTPRAALAAASTATGKGYVFGGVADVEETEEELRGELSDELHLLELDSCKWHRLELRAGRAPPAAARAQPAAAPAQPGDAPAVVTEVEPGFTLTLGGGAAVAPPVAPDAPPGAASPRARAGPCPRMSAMTCVQRSTLYVYGGVLERDDKQFYLSDMHSLDLHKLNEWKTIHEQPSLPDWLGSDSDSDDSGGSDGSGGSDADESDSEHTSDEE